MRFLCAIYIFVSSALFHFPLFAIAFVILIAGLIQFFKDKGTPYG